MDILSQASKLAETLSGVVGKPVLTGGYHYVPVKSGRANLAVVCGNGVVGFRLESARRQATEIPDGYVAAPEKLVFEACKQAFAQEPQAGLSAYDWRLPSRDEDELVAVMRSLGF